MKAIVKVQVPLMTSNPTPGSRGLVYAENRKFMIEQDFPDDVVKAMAGDPKAFFEAEFVDGVWKIGKRVKQESW